MHHHISTPTGKWLDLIANPEKYSTVILDGELLTTSLMRILKLTIRQLSAFKRGNGLEAVDRSTCGRSRPLESAYTARVNVLRCDKRALDCPT